LGIADCFRARRFRIYLPEITPQVNRLAKKLSQKAERRLSQKLIFRKGRQAMRKKRKE
jgi:hypothetical protein